MLNTKKLVLWLMVLVLMSSLVIAAFAISPIDMEEIVVANNINPYEYGMAPEDIYTFIYRGVAPHLSIDIDTSTCVLNRLYVYNETNGTVVEISQQNVREYTTTVDALFYVTVSNEIYKSDYTGQCAELIYRGDSGSVENMECYYDMFAFTQDDEIILMDLATRATQKRWSCNDIDYFFILSDTELLAVTLFEEFYIYDIVNDEPTAISADEVNYKLAQRRSTSASSQSPDVSIMTVYPGGLEYYENDVSFPLPEYPVNYGSSTYYQNYRYPDPARWFHTNTTLEGCSQSNCASYAGAGECMGFARYVHDKYNHMLDYTITDSNPGQWYVGKNMHHAVRDENDNLIFPYYFENEEKVISFFANLQTGNYVRYGHYDDDDIEDGIHSMVLVGKDSEGIWVYECNQNYYKDLTAGRINGRPKSFFGCGVHLQYHTYDVLAGRYDFVVKYTDHAYDEAPVYDNATYHKVGCTCCVGYLRQKHTSISASYINTSSHRATFNCCGGEVHTVPHTNVSTKLVSRTQHQTTYNCCNHSLSPVPHTGSVIYTEISSSKHSVRYSCCSGSVTEVHFFEYNENNQEECVDCGYIYNNLNSIEDEEIF